MCSIPGLPSTGSNIPVLIARVNLNPACVLVEFWGNFDQDRKFAYQQLKKGDSIPQREFLSIWWKPWWLVPRTSVWNMVQSPYSVQRYWRVQRVFNRWRQNATCHCKHFSMGQKVTFSIFPLKLNSVFLPMSCHYLLKTNGQQWP